MYTYNIQGQFLFLDFTLKDYCHLEFLTYTAMERRITSLPVLIMKPNSITVSHMMMLESFAKVLCQSLNTCKELMVYLKLTSQQTSFVVASALLN